MFLFHILGVKVLELVISMFCMSTMIFLIQIVFVCFISFELFSNPIQITNGLFIYFIIMLLLGWIGFLFGKYLLVNFSFKKFPIMILYNMPH